MDVRTDQTCWMFAGELFHLNSRNGAGLDLRVRRTTEVDGAVSQVAEGPQAPLEGLAPALDMLEKS